MKTMRVKNGLRWGALLAALLILGFITGTSFLAQQARAATGTMYLTGTNSVAHGGTVTLNLRINPGTAVTVTQSTVIYDATKLQYIGINTANSAFETTISQSQSSGTIQIDRATLNPAGVSNDALIATISFTALPYSGSTNVSLGASSNAAYDGNYTNPTLAGASINFTAGSCPSGQTGTPPSCTATNSGGGQSSPGKTSSSSSSSPNSTSAPATTPGQTTQPSSLVAPAITKTDFQYTLATITATTNVIAQVQLKYGLTADSLNFQTSPTRPGTSHLIDVSENLPVAATIYYQLVATDGKNTEITKTKSAKTKGLIANILLLDKARKPLSNQTVSIAGEQKKSSKDGYVSFDTLAPGEHQVELVSSGKKHKQSFVISANIITDNGKQTTPQQNIFVVYGDYTPATILDYWPHITGGIILVGAAVATYIWRRRGGSFRRQTMSDVPIEGLIVSGQGNAQASSRHIPLNEPAYDPFASKDTPTGSGK